VLYELEHCSAGIVIVTHAAAGCVASVLDESAESCVMTGEVGLGDLSR
jgi:hypothetical protein